MQKRSRKNNEIIALDFTDSQHLFKTELKANSWRNIGGNIGSMEEERLWRRCTVWSKIKIKNLNLARASNEKGKYLMKGFLRSSGFTWINSFSSLEDWDSCDGAIFMHEVFDSN